MKLCAALLAVTACSSKPAPIPDKPIGAPADAAMSIAPKPSVPDACWTKTDAIVEARLTDHVLAFCAEKSKCWRFELDTGAFTSLDKLPAPTTFPAKATLDEKSGQIELCTAGAKPACKSFKPPTPFGIGDEIVTSDDTKLVGRVKDQTTAEIYDATTAKLVRTHAGWKTEMGNPASIHGLTFVEDDRVIIWAAATPVSAIGKIYRLTDGGFVGPVTNDATFTQNMTDSWRVAPKQWAFKQIDGPRFYVVDVNLARLVRSYDLRQLVTKSDDLDDAGDHAEPITVGVTPDNYIVFVTRAGKIGLINTKTAVVKPYAPPACASNEETPSPK